jgi:outer membrane lipoprotein-sorting protein
MRLRTLALVAAAAPALLAGPADAQSADAIAQRLRQQYRSVRSLQADFTQVLGGQTLRGTVAVAGDAFRIELPDQTLVSDGRTLWSYSSEDNQVVVQDYRPQDMGFSVGQLLTDWTRQFRVTGASRATVSGVAHDVLALVPREAGSSVRDATLYVRSSDAVPARLRVHDVSGHTLAFDLRNVRLNGRLASGTFTFRTPAGAEVVDLRS